MTSYNCPNGFKDILPSLHDNKHSNRLIIYAADFKDGIPYPNLKPRNKINPNKDHFFWIDNGLHYGAYFGVD